MQRPSKLDFYRLQALKGSSAKPSSNVTTTIDIRTTDQQIVPRKVTQTRIIQPEIDANLTKLPKYVWKDMKKNERNILHYLASIRYGLSTKISDIKDLDSFIKMMNEKYGKMDKKLNKKEVYINIQLLSKIPYLPIFSHKQIDDANKSDLFEIYRNELLYNNALQILLLRFTPQYVDRLNLEGEDNNINVEESVDPNVKVKLPPQVEICNKKIVYRRANQKGDKNLRKLGTKGNLDILGIRDFSVQVSKKGVSEQGEELEKAIKEGTVVVGSIVGNDKITTGGRTMSLTDFAKLVGHGKNPENDIKVTLDPNIRSVPWLPPGNQIRSIRYVRKRFEREIYILLRKRIEESYKQYMSWMYATLNLKILDKNLTSKQIQTMTLQDLESTTGPIQFAESGINVRLEKENVKIDIDECGLIGSGNVPTIAPNLTLNRITERDIIDLGLVTMKPFDNIIKTKEGIFIQNSEYKLLWNETINKYAEDIYKEIQEQKTKEKEEKKEMIGIKIKEQIEKINEAIKKVYDKNDKITYIIPKIIDILRGYGIVSIVSWYNTNFGFNSDTPTQDITKATQEEGKESVLKTIRANFSIPAYQKNLQNWLYVQFELEKEMQEFTSEGSEEFTSEGDSSPPQIEPFLQVSQPNIQTDVLVPNITGGETSQPTEFAYEGLMGIDVFD